MLKNKMKKLICGMTMCITAVSYTHLYRNLVEPDVSSTENRVMAGFRIIIVAVTPETGLGSMIADICRGIGVKKPERHINTFDLVNVVFPVSYTHLRCV